MNIESNIKDSPFCLNLTEFIENQKLKDNDTLYICKYCGKEFEQANALGGHISTVHSTRKKHNKKKIKNE